MVAFERRLDQLMRDAVLRVMDETVGRAIGRLVGEVRAMGEFMRSPLLGDEFAANAAADRTANK